MKKAIGAMIVGTMLAPIDTNIPKDELSLFSGKPEISEFSKNKFVEQELSEALDINDYGIDQSEQERRQQLIQELIPQIKEPIILGDLTQPNVAITIDDGYGVESIKYMLDIFEKYDVKATFFVIGECLKLHPELWKRAAQQGHEICNHTAHHDKYFKTGNEPERFRRETIIDYERIYKEVLGQDAFDDMKANFPFFRFPGMHGIREKAYLDILKEYGYLPIGWIYTDNPKDGVVNNGDIFLWHFKDQDTINVRKSLELILKNGKRPMKVSDIITTVWYTEPIGWHNLYKKRNEVRNNVRDSVRDSVRNNINNSIGNKRYYVKRP